MNGEDAAGDAVSGEVADVNFAGVPAEPERLPTLRRALAEWAGRLGLSAEQAEAVSLASYEALANATAHAYADGQGTLDVHAEYRPDWGQVQVTVADSGRWRPPPAERDRQGGRGLTLIRSLAEDAEVDTDSSGTTVRMRWSAQPDPACAAR